MLVKDRGSLHVRVTSLALRSRKHSTESISRCCPLRSIAKRTRSGPTFIWQHVQPVLPERVCGSDATRRDSRQVRSSPRQGELHPPNPRQDHAGLEIKTQTSEASSE